MSGRVSGRQHEPIPPARPALADFFTSSPRERACPGEGRGVASDSEPGEGLATPHPPYPPDWAPRSGQRLQLAVLVDEVVHRRIDPLAARVPFDVAGGAVITLHHVGQRRLD